MQHGDALKDAFGDALVAFEARGGIVVLAAPAGSGKSFTVRQAAHEIPLTILAPSHRIAREGLMHRPQNLRANPPIAQKWISGILERCPIVGEPTRDDHRAAGSQWTDACTDCTRRPNCPAYTQWYGLGNGAIADTSVHSVHALADIFKGPQHIRVWDEMPQLVVTRRWEFDTTLAGAYTPHAALHAWLATGPKTALRALEDAADAGLWNTTPEPWGVPVDPIFADAIRSAANEAVEVWNRNPPPRQYGIDLRDGNPFQWAGPGLYDMLTALAEKPSALTRTAIHVHGTPDGARRLVITHYRLRLREITGIICTATPPRWLATACRNAGIPYTLIRPDAPDFCGGTLITAAGVTKGRMLCRDQQGQVILTRTGSNTMVRIMRALADIREPGDVLLISYKGLDTAVENARRVCPELDDALRTMHNRTVHWAHYGAAIGTNAWEDCAIVVTIGDAIPNVTTAREIAALLDVDPQEVIDDTSASTLYQAWHRIRINRNAEHKRIIHVGTRTPAMGKWFTTEIGMGRLASNAAWHMSRVIRRLQSDGVDVFSGIVRTIKKHGTRIYNYAAAFCAAGIELNRSISRATREMWRRAVQEENAPLTLSPPTRVDIVSTQVPEPENACTTVTTTSTASSPASTPPLQAGTQTWDSWTPIAKSVPLISGHPSGPPSQQSRRPSPFSTPLSRMAKAIRDAMTTVSRSKLSTDSSPSPAHCATTRTSLTME